MNLVVMPFSVVVWVAACTPTGMMYACRSRMGGVARPPKEEKAVALA